jgi:hypothetical protein
MLALEITRFNSTLTSVLKINKLDWSRLYITLSITQGWGPSMNSSIHRAALGIALGLLGQLSITQAVQPESARDWQAEAIRDLTFIHQALGANHPGPVDPLNPGFRDWFENGYQQSLDNAAQANGYAGYYYAVQSYVAGFQDGHLWALERALRDEQLDWQWPNFVLSYQDSQFLVSQLGAESGLAIVDGDQLISCDGVSATDMAQRKLQTYVGLWSVEGARPRFAPFLLTDGGNPFLDRPRGCRFETSSGEVTIELPWQAISSADLSDRIAAAQQRFRPPLSVRSFSDDAYWIGLPSFNGSDQDTADGLRDILRELGDNAQMYRDADVIVLDVRGNLGGSSSYGTAIAASLWGQTYIDYATPQADHVDWRASPDNQAFMTDNQLADTLVEYGPDHEYAVYYRALITGMQVAMETGRDYHPTNQAESRSVAQPETITAKIFFLTDSYCSSACLGFADILRAIPDVTHIGVETSADAIYIDTAHLDLPSGLGSLTYPMKVYRGRPRGHNQSYQPHHLWSGGMADTPAIEEWVLELTNMSPVE